MNVAAIAFPSHLNYHISYQRPPAIVAGGLLPLPSKILSIGGKGPIIPSVKGY